MSKEMFGFIRARNKSALTLVGSLCLALCLVSAPAYADTIGAHAGYQPTFSVELVGSGCFRDEGPTMVNFFCFPNAELVIPLTTRRAGNTAISVSISGNSVDPTVCQAFVTDPNTGVTVSGIRDGTSNGFPPATRISLGIVSVPATHSLWVSCTVAPGGRVQGVEWTQ
jgi:hypothetical protein